MGQHRDCISPYLKQGFDGQLDSLIVPSNGFVCVILLQELSHRFCTASDCICLFPPHKSIRKVIH